MTTVYDFDVQREDGSTYSLSEYRGHPLLIVNTATKCGLAGQFDGLEKLYEDYRDQGLIVLGFPSNQFHQEIDSSEAAAEACRMTYGVQFPMHSIQDVNGPNASPLFKHLRQAKGSLLGNAIKWNFTKFLVDANGEVVNRFAPQTKPEKLTSEIEKVLI